MTPGQIAFEAYCASTGGKTFDGRPIPAWDELHGDRARIHAAWEAAAQAVLAEMSIVRRYPGGPWTTHGHAVDGVTVAGAGRPPVVRCGGPRVCKTCSVEAEQLRAAARSAG